MLPRLTAFLAIALCAAPSLALDLNECEDELSVEPAVAAPIAPVAPARVILPCAVAEQVLTSTGDLACADATLYVVTHAGTLLCEVDVPALVASSSTVERAPTATLSASSAFSAAGLFATSISVLPPLVVDLPRASLSSGARPQEGFGSAPSVPS